MRGGYLHNQVLIGTLQRDAKALGCETQLEVPVQVQDSVWFIDLVVRSGSVLIAVEAELSARRVVRDLLKARALQRLW